MDFAHIKHPIALPTRIQENYVQNRISAGKPEVKSSGRKIRVTHNVTRVAIAVSTADQQR